MFFKNFYRNLLQSLIFFQFLAQIPHTKHTIQSYCLELRGDREQLVTIFCIMPYKFLSEWGLHSWQKPRGSIENHHPVSCSWILDVLWLHQCQWVPRPSDVARISPAISTHVISWYLLNPVIWVNSFSTVDEEAVHAVPKWPSLWSRSSGFCPICFISHEPIAVFSSTVRIK